MSPVFYMCCDQWYFWPSYILSPVTSAQGTDLISGQSLNLTCGLGFSLPSHLQLKWIPPGRSSPRPTLTSSSLHITVDVSDSGKWRCELWEGDSKKTSAVITLKIGEDRRCIGGGRKGQKAVTLWPKTSRQQEIGFYLVPYLLDERLLVSYTEQRHSVWMLVIICSATVIGFLLLLLVFILWRRRQVKLKLSHSSVFDHTALLIRH